ncbi:hypothetical protein ACFL6K_04775 [Candidatus Latescibacterota bacterium]
MTNSKIIGIVAKTEAKMFARSWIFRFFVLITLGILVFFNYLFFTHEGTWRFRSISSSIPYFNFLLLTVFESLIVIFGAIDSNQQDYKLDTSESLHAHTFTNLSYMTGKVIGIMIPCLIMNLVVFILAFVINVVFADDVPFVWQAYVLYPLLLSFPPLFFMTSLSFAVVNILKNKPLSLLVLVGYYILTIMFSNGIFARLMDFTGIHLPMLYSSFVGLENIGSILAQRGFFVFAAFGCLMVSAIFFKRIPQSLNSRRFSVTFSTVFIAAAVISGAFYVTGIYSGITLREDVRLMNEKYIGNARAKVTACDLDVAHKGSNIDVTSTLTVLNPNSEQMNSVFFSLNPGFKVTSVTAGGTELEFTRDTQILDITLGSPLMPDEETVLNVAYEGNVNDEACYPDIERNERIKPSRFFLYIINKRYGFITKDYVLLTPECQWYPISGIPFGMVFPDAYQKDFTDYKLDISTDEGLTAVSQGAMEKNGDGQYSFRPESKLHGITLTVGDYEKKAIEVDGVEIALYHRPGHDYFSEDFKGTSETLISTIEDLKLDYEYDKSMKYPFPRYLIVESPVQFHAYERPWSTYMETGQPQMSIIPEKGFFLENFNLDLASTRNFYVREYQGQIYEEEILKSVFSGLNYVFMNDGLQRRDTKDKRSFKALPLSFTKLLRSIFISSYRPGYTLSSQLFPYMISFESEKYPVFNTVMEFYHKHGLNLNTQRNSRRESRALMDEEIACMALENDTFANFIVKGSDFDTMNMLLMLKANHLFAEIQAASGKSDFEVFLNEFIKEHAFSSVKFEEFAETVEKKYGLNIDAIFETWYNDSRMPMYTISDATLTEVIDGDYTSYQTAFTITNTEPVPGIVCVQLRLEGDDYTTERGSRFITIEGNQTQEIGFVTETAPPDITINTMISKNLPLIYFQSLGKPKVDHDMEPFDGERIVAYSPPENEPGTIIVDNLDGGFEIISEPKKTSDGNQYNDIYHAGYYPEGFIACIPNWPPKYWGKSVFYTSYGGKSTAIYTRSGDGEGCVAWNADIPEQGNYDLEFFLPDFNIIQLVRFADDPNENKPLFGEYNLSIKCDGQDNSVTFIPEQTQPGWQYVSSFDLEPGNVCVELSNKSNGILIYADAIRWVKQK